MIIKFFRRFLSILERPLRTSRAKNNLWLCRYVSIADPIEGIDTFGNFTSKCVSSAIHHFSAGKKCCILDLYPALRQIVLGEFILAARRARLKLNLRASKYSLILSLAMFFALTSGNFVKRECQPFRQHLNQIYYKVIHKACYAQRFSY